ncbi:MAG: VanZ family protein [Lachnospiraceae bacterium]|nr:VanZ family protein [Lachnospiraceae bacterium]
MRPQTKLKWLLAADLLWIAFIFLHSLQTAEISAQESGALLALLQKFFPSLTMFLIRKAGHFFEFFVLGVLFVLTARCLRALSQPPKRSPRFPFWAPAAAGLIIAACDEAIQLGVEGRSGELRDVFIDFCGVLMAAALLWAARRKDKTG